MRRPVAQGKDTVIGAATAGDRCAKHPYALAAERHERARIRRECAHSAHQIVGRPREVELAFAWLELRSERDLPQLLRPPHDRAREVPRRLALQQFATELRETFFELASRLVADLRS